MLTVFVSNAKLLAVVLTLALFPLTLARAQVSPSQGGTSVADRFRDQSLGEVGAGLVIYETIDFQCPYCAQFALETLPELEREYIQTGKVRWIFLNRPRPSHVNARAASTWAMCASGVGRFKQMHDALYATQEHWNELANPVGYFRQIADSLGLPGSAMSQCLESEYGEKAISSDSTFYSTWVDDGVPGFYVDGKVILAGNEPVETFRAAIDSVLRATPARLKAP